MVKNSFKLCGSHSFPRDDSDDEFDHHERRVLSAGSSPQRSITSSRCKTALSFGGGGKHNNNPYSNRGLDKFTALLAEIEEKRQQIYSEFSPDEIDFVRFDFSKGNNFKPIVVKAKPNNNTREHQSNSKASPTATTPATASPDRRRHHSGPLDRYPPPPRKMISTTPGAAASSAISTTKRVDNEIIKSSNNDTHHHHHQCRCELKNLNLHKLRNPRYYLPATLILILILLVLFGRSVAIMCTSIGWYLIPTVTSYSSMTKRSFKKKKLVGGNQQPHTAASFKRVSRSSSPTPPTVAAKCGLRKNR